MGISVPIFGKLPFNTNRMEGKTDGDSFLKGQYHLEPVALLLYEGLL